MRWKRYQIFAGGVRNIKAFNDRPKGCTGAGKQPGRCCEEKVSRGGWVCRGSGRGIVVPRDGDIVIPEKLDYIVVIIDARMDAGGARLNVEMAIARITQMARAAGIPCIVATQRPSVDVIITGVIKVTFTARIAFQVAAKVDSRTILDQMGADKLLGKGTCLYLPPGSGRLLRCQGALITDHEIEKVVGHIAAQGKAQLRPRNPQCAQKAQGSMGSMSLDPDDGMR